MNKKMRKAILGLFVAVLTTTVVGCSPCGAGGCGSSMLSGCPGGNCGQQMLGGSLASNFGLSCPGGNCPLQ